MRIGSFWNNDDHPLFNLNRKSRKDQRIQIVIEALRRLAKGPLTKPELQKLVRIRKKTLLPILKYLLEIGAVTRTGQGTKGDPFKYQLADHYR